MKSHKTASRDRQNYFRKERMAQFSKDRNAGHRRIRKSKMAHLYQQVGTGKKFPGN
jgi:hypothetical protein